MWDFIRTVPADAAPMHAVRTLVSALALYDPEADDGSLEANERKGLRILARVPALIANFDRHRNGREFIRPDSSLDIAASFLTMLNGTTPTDTMGKALDVCLILHADHGFNASTFAGLVTIATLSDMYSAVTTAIGTLKGPLHGGANEAVMHMLAEIPDLAAVDAYIHGKLERREKIMGFGHRVYRAYDPRATYLKTFAKQLAVDTGNENLYDMSYRIEQIMHEAVAARGIHPNVDFYSATTYYSIGLAIDLFTPMFVMSRVAGWVGHCMEQLARSHRRAIASIDRYAASSSLSISTGASTDTRIFSALEIRRYESRKPMRRAIPKKIASIGSYMALKTSTMNSGVMAVTTSTNPAFSDAAATNQQPESRKPAAPMSTVRSAPAKPNTRSKPLPPVRTRVAIVAATITTIQSTWSFVNVISPNHAATPTAPPMKPAATANGMCCCDRRRST
jgi:citrate synthase